MCSPIDLLLFSGVYAGMSMLWIIYRMFWNNGRPSINDRIAFVGGLQWLALQVAIITCMLFLQ
jgi:hypothetical protein